MASLHVAIVRADLPAVRRNALLLAGLVAWMAYTRVFWAAHAAHATLPPCPFLRLTGHPCPLCGGTRSFAYMWRGDVAHASALYPLGPVMFFATAGAVPVLAFAVAARLDLEWRLSRQWQRALSGAVLGVLAASWVLKLTMLPN